MKVRIFSKKLLALTLCFAMLLSCIVWSGVSAALSGKQIAVMDLSAMPLKNGADAYSNSGGGNNYVGTDASATVTTGADGYITLKYLNNGATVTPGFRYFPNEFASGYTSDFKLKANTAYHVSFKYKVINAPVAATIKSYVTSFSWASGTPAAGWGSPLNLTIAAGTTHTEWQTYSYTFTTSGGNGYHFALWDADNTACAGLEVQMTDIVISTPTTVTFDYGYDSLTETVTGGTGEAITFPTAPTRSGYTFKGWNTKADGSGSYVTAATFGEDVTYYAIWQKTDSQIAVMDLSTMPLKNGADAYSNSGGGNNYVGADASATVTTGADGYITLKYLNNGATATPAFRYFPNEFVSGYSSDFKLKANTAYHVSFKYKVISAPVAASLKSYVTSKSWVNGDPGVGWASPLNLTIAAGTTHTEWQTYSYTFTTSGGNGYHFALWDADDTACAGLEVQMTDIVISLPATATLDYGYEGKTEQVSGAVGAAIPFPAPIRSGYTFEGWNTKADGSGDYVTDATFGSTNVTYYAVWKQRNDYIAVMDLSTMPQKGNADAYSNAGGGNNYVGTDASATVTTGADGYITLKYLNNGATVTPGFRYFPNEFASGYTSDFKLKANTAYHVSFKYKVINAPVAATIKSYVTSFSWASGTPAAGWGSPCNLTIAAGTTHTEWQTYSYTFTTGGGNGFHFALWDADGAACAGLEVQMTDIVLSPPVTATLDYGYEGKTEQVFGAVGEAIPFPTAPIRSGYAFEGWNTKADGSGDFVTTAAFASTNVTYYAVWTVHQEITSNQVSVLHFGTMPQKGGADAYSNAGGGNNYVGADASAVATTGTDGYITLKYLNNGATVTPGYRYFPNQRADGYADDFKLHSDTTYRVTFKYKVINAPVAATIRSYVTSYNWANGTPNATWSSPCNLALQAGKTHTEWQTYSYTFTTTGSNGFHFALWSADNAACAGLEVQMTDIVIDIPTFEESILGEADTMTFEVDESYVPTVYAHTDLSKTAVQDYYKNNSNNWYTQSAAKHSIVKEGFRHVMKVEYGDGANATNKLYGFRLTDANGQNFVSRVGTVYCVTFKYKTEGLPTDTYATVIEGSQPWAGQANPIKQSGYNEFDGTLIPAGSTNGTWRTATVVFRSQTANGVHLTLRSTDMANREGAVLYFTDIKVQSYQVTEFTLTDGAVRDKTGVNNTPAGTASIKVNTATDGRVVFANGVGDCLFDTNTINVAEAWLYSAENTEATLVAYNDPDKGTPQAVAHKMGEKTVTLKAGEWTRVYMEFGLTAVKREDATYVSFGISTPAGKTVYLDDLSMVRYPNRDGEPQGYERFEAKTYPGSNRMDTTIHGLNGNTVVSGIGYESEQSLRITMNTETPLDVARTVLMNDKMDATGTVGNGYMVTFYAMVPQAMNVSFGIGTTERLDLQERDDYANTVEYDAQKTVSLQANVWTPVWISVSDLQGKNPELVLNPYVTLAAWFEGAAPDNTAPVYIDNVTLQDYIASAPPREDTLCLENTDVYGFGYDMNMAATGTINVALDYNHSDGGYHSLKVKSLTKEGGNRPQFNLLNANGQAVRVEKGKDYRVTFYVYVDEDRTNQSVNYWLSVTDSTTAYTATSQKNAEVVKEGNVTPKKGEWVKVSEVLKNVPRDGYVRLGVVSSTVGDVFYLDDLRVGSYKEPVLTGNETVQDFENFNLDDDAFIRHGEGAVYDDFNHTENGTYALKLVGRTWDGGNRNQFILVDPATMQPKEFVKGEMYVLRFWLYYSLESVPDFAMNAWLLGVDDVNTTLSNPQKNALNGTYEFDGTVRPLTEDGYVLPDTWTQFEINFVAQNGKYMLMGTTNSALSGGGYTYYLDDFEFSKPVHATVTFDPNGGAFDEGANTLNDKGQYVESNYVGQYAAGPFTAPYLENKRFMGWALDPEGQQEFNIAVDPINKENLTLYAMWGDWNAFGTIDKGEGDKEEIKYKTEIHSEKVWTGNATIPSLDVGEPPSRLTADPIPDTPVTEPDPQPGNDGLPVWLIMLIIAIAVIVVGGGALLALVLLKNKKANEKEAT